LGLPSSIRGIDSVLATGSTFAAGSTLTDRSLRFCAECELRSRQRAHSCRLDCDARSLPPRQDQPSRLPTSPTRALPAPKDLKANCITSLAARHCDFGLS
jgi:hypothetical protein